MQPDGGEGFADYWPPMPKMPVGEGLRTPTPAFEKAGFQGARKPHFSCCSAQKGIDA